MWSVPWNSTVPARPSYMLRSLENARSADCYVCVDSLHSRRRARTMSPSTICNPVHNPRVNCRGDDREGLVDQ